MSESEFTTALCALRADLVAFAWRRCGSRALAEDLAHDAMVKAMQARLQFDGRNLKAWLLRILVNHHCTLHRREKFLVGAKAQPERCCEFTGDVECDLIAAVRAAESLSLEHRSVIAALMAGGEWRAAAADLGVSLGTLKSRASRARAALNARLALPNGWHL